MNIKSFVLKINMSGIITGVLNSTFGLLCDKLRDVAARRLSEGDLTDEKFRKLIVRELDDIKCKLDGLARKDLLSSISFLKEGICRLNTCLYDRHISFELESFQEDQVKCKAEDKGSPFQQAVSCCSKKPYGVDDAFALSNAIKELTIFSEDRLMSVKSSFVKSREEATRAFNNSALSIEDRIVACKLRVASRILESLQDPESAAFDCLLYIEELHSLSAVQEIFSVHVKGGIKSRLKQTKRIEKSRSITSLNFHLLEFVSKFTKIAMGVFNWPTINVRSGMYHPVFDEEEMLKLVERSKMNATWETLFDERLTIEGYHGCAVNSKGEIFVINGKWNRLADIKVIRRSGHVEMFSGDVVKEKRVMYSVSSLAVDIKDNIYLGTCCLDVSIAGVKVVVFQPSGTIERDVFLAVENYFADFCLTVSVDKFIVCSAGGHMYFFDQKNFTLDNSFPLCGYDSIVESAYVSQTEDNDLVVNYPRGKCVNVCSERGELKRVINLPNEGNTNELVQTVRGVSFDKMRQIILVLIYNPFLFDRANYRLLVYSKSGELLNTYVVPSLSVQGVVQLTSHPSGPIAVVGAEKAIFFQL